jgi:hypothetical protein
MKNKHWIPEIQKSLLIMVMFRKGQLIQYKNYNGEAVPDEEAGRILDPIIDTTNTFTGAYLVCFFSLEIFRFMH